jgi:superfamily II DNA/RNA helicase
MAPDGDGPQCLILCPTRELAVQVHDSIRRISKFTKVKTAVIVGGISAEKQGKGPFFK